MNKKIVFMFSGQGSQFFHMGRGLYDTDNVFRTAMDRMDDIVQYLSGRSVVREIYDPATGKWDTFDDISLSHPAIFMVQTALVRTLAEKGIVPDAVMGTSLGEFVGAALYGGMDFETGFRKVIRQPMVFKDDLAPGGMIAVMGSPDIYDNTPVLNENCEISAINMDAHFVVSAEGGALDRVKQHLTDAGINHLALPVTYAFHSAHLETIREKFVNLYSGVAYHSPDVAFYSCSDAGRIEGFDPQFFWRVIRQPIRFMDAFTALASEGPCIFVDLGPSGTLATFAKYILPEDSPSEIRPILTPFGGEQENYARVLAELPRRSRPAPKTGLVKKIKEMPAPSPARRKILGRDLGSPEFKKRFNLAYACLAGGMSRGISSPALVTRMGNAGMLAFLGAYGLSADQVDQHISQVTRGLESGREFGVNLPAGPDEDILVDLCVKRKVSCIEASGFIGVTPALVRYKAAGMENVADVSGRSGNRIIVKLSRPEVAADFLRPPGDRILDKLVGSGQISLAQADEMKRFPVADAICVAADGGGPTQRGSTATLLPAMIRLRDRVKKEYGYKTQVFVGTCGGIGTPEAAASAFILGADFVLTGSINQCTPEAGTSERVKDMLQQINVQDTAYAPASVGFEIGVMVQVMSRGVFFPARAGRLSSLYQHHDSLADIPKSVLGRICDKYFDLSPESVYDADTSGFSGAVQPDGTKSLNKKQRMARIFKWYLDKSFSLALAGGDTDVVNYQVYCGPCLGAFNQWVTGTEYEGWQARHVDDMNRRIMNAAADLLTRQFHGLAGTGSARK